MVTPAPGLRRTAGTQKVSGLILTAADVLGALTLLHLDGVRLEDYDAIFDISENFTLTIYPREA